MELALRAYREYCRAYREYYRAYLDYYAGSEIDTPLGMDIPDHRVHVARRIYEAGLKDATTRGET